jgi:hypothetical protein
VDVWESVIAIGTVAAAVAAWQSRSSSGRANAAAETANAAAVTLAEIERDRRRAELTPRLRVRCEPWNAGSDILRLRVMLLGPPGLNGLDRLTVSIRNDHFRRGEGVLLAASPTREQIRNHIWGPYQFTPGVGPDDQLADATGRTTVYDLVLPVGEELPFQLEPTRPPQWATSTTPEDWRRERGNVIRLAFIAEHARYGAWTLPAEVDVGDGSEPVTVEIPHL